MNIAELTAGPCFDAFSEDVLINGSPARGILATELIELGAFDQVAEQRQTLSVMTREVPALPRGASVVIRGKTYTVDAAVTGTGDPDVVTKVLLR